LQILKRRSDAIYLTEMGAFIARRITSLASESRISPISINGFMPLLK
jgi:hypothetical protein